MFLADTNSLIYLLEGGVLSLFFENETRIKITPSILKETKEKIERNIKCSLKHICEKIEDEFGFRLDHRNLIAQWENFYGGRTSILIDEIQNHQKKAINYCKYINKKIKGEGDKSILAHSISDLKIIDSVITHDFKLIKLITHYVIPVFLLELILEEGGIKNRVDARVLRYIFKESLGHFPNTLEGFNSSKYKGNDALFVKTKKIKFMIDKLDSLTGATYS